MPALVNVDPLNPNAGAPDPAELLAFNIRGVRQVVRNDDSVRDYKNRLQAAGLLVLGVVTEQSEGYVGEDSPYDVIQLGNEPDRIGHADTKSASQYVNWWRTYYGTWFAPGQPLSFVPVIGAGLESGDVTYWRQVRDAGNIVGAAGFAVHPYNKSASQAQTLIRAYMAVMPSVPCWITEWYREAIEITQFVTMLRTTPGIVGHAFFCWHDYLGMQLGTERARLLGATA